MATSSLPSIPSASLHSFPTSEPSNKRRKPPPVSISTNPSHLAPLQLRDLLTASNLSCHRFPALGPDGRPEPVDLAKLRTALAHSFVVVSAFCRSKYLSEDGRGEVSGFGFEELFERMSRRPDSDHHQLVGFGRAVSDGGLTASIHDVAVIPSLRRLGIGRKIVERITRVLTSRDIYDISALCSEEERLFFEACGFGGDTLGATTMMYTRAAPSYLQDDLMVRPAGRMLLLVPPVPHPCLYKSTAVEMVKIRIEVCIISARGLRRSSLLKPQWFAVGWMDPNNRYCTKVDSSRSSNPTWKTKFSVAVDDTNLNMQEMSLTVEVYRREPIFLRERLQGTATVLLKEFFAKFAKAREASGTGIEETGSFQLRKRITGKPQGFVDISLHVSEEREGVTSSGIGEGYQYSDHKNEIQLAIEDGRVIPYPSQPQLPGNGQFGGYTRTSYPYSHPMAHPNTMASGSVNRRPPTPPPPPPPSNTGFLPALFPGSSRPSETYVNLPPTGPPDRNSRSGFGMGLGAGALAAGAVIFGDDFLSSSGFPTGFEGGSLTLSTDPPF